jgi:YhcH/YjgK/YiaL family protein
MIVDKLKNIELYKSMIPNLNKGLEAIQEQMGKMETGRYEFDGGFFMVQKGESKPMAEGLFEAHRKFIDIQIVVAGDEEIAWAELGDSTEKTPYDEVKDAAYYEASEKNSLYVSEGMFYVAFPHDAHKAIRHTSNSHKFEKIVLKMPVGQK